jgi:hypothetical protein
MINDAGKQAVKAGLPAAAIAPALWHCRILGPAP